MMNILASMFVFVNETGSNQCDFYRENAYGLCGQTPVSLKCHAGNGERISAIAAMTTNSIEDFTRRTHQ